MQPALWDGQIQQAATNAADGWCDAALVAVRHAAARHRRFTTDEVWAELMHDTHEHRALGAVMRRARSLGLCEPTGEYRSSTREIAHGRPVRVWRAL